VMLGGRAAEEIVLGDITTGAENDLVEATRLVRRMITRWAMGELGPIAYQADEQQPFLGYELSQGRDYSESTAARIDQEVQRVMGEQYEAVRQLLLGARSKLDSLVDQLLEEETVLEEQLTAVLGPRPEPQPAPASVP
jgi:cell division protease FtsH